MTPGNGSRPPSPLHAGRVDRTLASALLIGSTVYVACLPHAIGISDEGLYLYEAKRLLDGQVFYRDIFDLITPGAHYLMAVLFACFGASMTTARLADAVVHGLIVLVTYATCRTLGVRRGLAAVAALTQVAVFQPAWAVASPHWLATLGGLLLLRLLLAQPDARRGFVAGVVAGLLVCVQQQKGVALTAGAAALLVAERLVLPRPARPGGGRIPAFVGGFVLVLLPAGALLVLSAGVRPVVQALVMFPLYDYTKLNKPPPWGSVGPFPWYARYTFPKALAALPGLAAVEAARTIGAFVRGRDAEHLRRLMILTVMAAASIGSILYYPDFVHLSFIGVVFAVVAAEVVESVLGWFGPRSALGRAIGVVLVVGLVAATGLQLANVMTGSWRDYPFSYVTPFSRMDFHKEEEIDVVRRIRAEVDRSSSRELLVYPFGAAYYLLTGTSNPTPFQFLLPGYSRPDQLERAVTILEERQVQHVIYVMPLFRVTGDDPVLRYLHSHFEQVQDERGKLPLFRRVPRRTG